MRGLVEGSRDAFLKSENNGDGGSDWDSHKIGHGTHQLQASQVAGESVTHSGAPQTSNEHCQIRLATPAQLRVVDKLLDPREMELPDAAYEGTRLADDRRYGKPCGNTQLAKTLAVHDRADPAAAKVVIIAGSNFEGTSPKFFWPETLIYSLPGAELNQMLTLVVAIKSEMPCEPELLLFAGMNDHLHATGFLEQLKGDEPAPKII